MTATYIRQERRNRETGSTVQVLDTTAEGSEFEPELEEETGRILNRWISICCDHGILCSHPTLELARYHAAAPSGWCQGCRGEDLSAEAS